MTKSLYLIAGTVVLAWPLVTLAAPPALPPSVPVAPGGAAAIPAPADASAPKSDSGGDGSPIDLEKRADNYEYSPQGRRDPFISLLKPVTANEQPGIRPKGINGFIIQEVALKGVVK